MFRVLQKVKNVFLIFVNKVIKKVKKNNFLLKSKNQNPILSITGGDKPHMDVNPCEV